jgi:uncharacterized membrane protein
VSDPAGLQQHGSGDHLRFHGELDKLSGAFGGDSFGRKAERFARFFGTPTFILLQTGVVVVWIVLNATGTIHFDLYPFILLNLGFSLQAAYAAPLILLAQTRQADRDKALAEADARHREDIARIGREGQHAAQQQAEQLHALLVQNTALTEETHRLTAEVDKLARAIHEHITAGG